jgi:TRAP-type mannitol/chloroaromatic compound transport system permease large subunit
VNEFVLGLPVNRWLIIIMMQVIWFAMGCFFDPMTITLLTIPIFVPIIRNLGFDGVWFGVLYIMNNETAFLTPPYGLNLFYLKAVAPKEVSMRDIYQSVLPFVSIQLAGLVLCMVFPAIALWLPNTLFGAPM